MTLGDTKFSKWLNAFALSQFIALMLIVFLQFCTRYLLNDSLAWTEEFARYILVCLVFTGSLILALMGEHIFLEVTYRLSNKGNTKPLALFSTLMSLFYYMSLALFGVFLTLNTKQTLISAPLPKALIYGLLSLTLALSALACAQRIRKLWSQSGEEILADIEKSVGNSS